MTVGTGGTYKSEPGVILVLSTKQFPVLKLSAVVLYRSAIAYSVSFTPTVMGTHPPGMVHVFIGVMVAKGGDVSVGIVVGILCVGSGDANSTANVVGLRNGVGVGDGADVSANANEIPPMTSISEIAPMTNPLPIWRRAFMIIPPTLGLVWRWEVIR